ncbi:hypothetical protein FNO01nite_14030 [Flavobacterium noncentrifugens]|nr:hypothetical protein FNO01nite_14030 [Flavobacterium noncentrifugens]
MLDNEISIFSFTTKKGKIVSLSKDKDDEYIVYRYGTKEKIELEFPKKDKESWEKFKFNGVERHGGKENNGMAICNVMFENKNYRYILYTSYLAEADPSGNDITEIGLYVKDLITKKGFDIEGEINSQKGNLYDFRSNGLLKFEDFDLY